MKKLYYLIGPLFLLLISLEAHGQAKKYKAGTPMALGCGQRIAGTYSGSKNDFDSLQLAPTGVYIYPNYGPRAVGVEKLFKITLTSPSYVNVSELGTTSPFLAISLDSSNQSVIIYGQKVIQTMVLQPGSYFVLAASDTTLGAAYKSFSLQVQCSPQTDFTHGNLKAVATPVTFDNTIRFKGDLFGGKNKIDAYLYGYSFQGGYPYYCDLYFNLWFAGLPNPDTIFSFKVSQTSYLRNTGGTLYDTTGYVGSGRDYTGTNVKTNLPVSPGTYYLLIDQASFTTAYDVSLSVVPAQCSPTLVNKPTYPTLPDHLLQYGNCGNMVADVSSPMLVGGALNAIIVAAGPGFVHAYIDLNADGDFDDAGEKVYQSAQSLVNYQGVYDKLVDYFTLPASSAYTSALGKTLRMRVMVTDTIKGPCSTYTFGDYYDLWITLGSGAPPADVSLFYKQVGDVDNDANVRVRRQSDGSTYVASNPTVPSYQSGYPYPDQAYTTGQTLITNSPQNWVKLDERPDSLIIKRDYSYRYKYLEGLSLINKYDNSGKLLWYSRIVCGGYSFSSGPNAPPSLAVNGLVTDATGNVFVCGSFTPGITIYNQDGTIAASFSNGGNYNNFNYDNSCGFVIKYNPNGTVLYAFPIEHTAGLQAYLTAIDVLPDGSYYVSGHFSVQAPPSGPAAQSMTLLGTSGNSITLTTRGGNDAFIAKFNSAGQLQWVSQAGGSGDDFSNGVATNKNGDAYLLGTFAGSASFSGAGSGGTPVTKTANGASDGFVLNLAADGSYKWVTPFGSAGADTVSDISADPRGTGVVVVGSLRGAATFGTKTITSHGGSDAFAARLNTAGGFDWATSAGQAGADMAQSVRVTKTGQALVGLSFEQTVTNPFGAANPITSQGFKDAAIFLLDATTGVAGCSAPVLLGGPSGDESALGIDTSSAGHIVAVGAMADSVVFPGFINPTKTMGATDGWLAQLAMQPAAGPTITASGPTTLCSGQSVRLSSSAASGNVWSVGNSPYQSVTVNAAGSYTVRQVVGACTTASSAPVVVSLVSTKAPTVTASGPVALCGGASVTLTSSSASGNVWSNGATTASIAVSTAGNYTVKTVSQGCSSASSTPVVVTINNSPTPPTISPAGPVSLCSGQSVRLSSSAASGNIWSAGNAPYSAITVNISGTYTVRQVVGTCTTASSTPVVVNVITTKAPTITAGGSTTLCGGSSVTLSSSSPTNNVWSSGETTPSISVSKAGSYTVQIVSASCSSAISAPVLVNVTTAIPPPTITPSGSTVLCPGQSVGLYSSAASGNLWSVGNLTYPSIRVSMAGSYTVRQVVGTCTTAASVPVVVTKLASCGGPPQARIGDNQNELSNAGSLGVLLYPNPVANGLLNVASESVIKTIKVYTVTGMKVYDATLNTSYSELAVPLKSGTYLVETQLENGTDRKLIHWE